MTLRESRFRRDLNELLLYRDGKVEYTKFWSNVGYGIVCYWMLTVPAKVWEDWVGSIAIASLLIAPNLVSKAMSLKHGAKDDTK